MINHFSTKQQGKNQSYTVTCTIVTFLKYLFTHKSLSLSKNLPFFYNSHFIVDNLVVCACICIVPMISASVTMATQSSTATVLNKFFASLLTKMHLWNMKKRLYIYRLYSDWLTSPPIKKCHVTRTYSLVPHCKLNLIFFNNKTQILWERRFLFTTWVLTWTRLWASGSLNVVQSVLDFMQRNTNCSHKLIRTPCVTFTQINSFSWSYKYFIFVICILLLFKSF